MSHRTHYSLSFILGGKCIHSNYCNRGSVSQQLIPCGPYSENIKAWVASVTDSMANPKSLKKYAQTTENRDTDIGVSNPGEDQAWDVTATELFVDTSGRAANISNLHTFFYISLSPLSQWEMTDKSYIEYLLLVLSPDLTVLLFNVSHSFWMFLNRQTGFSPFLYFATEIMTRSESMRFLNSFCL